MLSLRKRIAVAVGIVGLSLTLPIFAASTKAQLQTLVPQVQQIAAQSDIVAAVSAANQANANLSKADIRNLGKEWHQGLEGKNSPVLTQVNNSPLSSELKNIVTQSNGAYAAILVTDSKGLVVGQTYNADHYSQAHRSVWSKIAKDGVNATYYGKAQQTEQGNLAALGLPIVQNNQVIGAIVVEAKVTPAASKPHHKKADQMVNS